jgi:hypothetical protein
VNLDDVVLLVAVYADAAGRRSHRRPQGQPRRDAATRSQMPCGLITANALEILASRETARNHFYRGD